jgi:hypothetical protein
MPDTTTSSNPPDSTPQASAPPAALAAVEAMPRQEMPPTQHHEMAPGYPLPPPWPQGEYDDAGTAPVNELPEMENRCGVGRTDESSKADAYADDDMDVESDFSPRRREDNATRPLFAPEQWVSDPDFWETKTHIALTGRHPVPRPKTLPLKPPQRFHPVPRWRSLLILVLVCGLIAFTVVGVVEIGRLGMQVLGPTHHVATPAPTHTLAVPTATPHHKK